MLTEFKVKKAIEVSRNGGKCKEMVAIEVGGSKRKIHLIKQASETVLPRGAILGVDIDGSHNDPVVINGLESTYKLRDVIFM